MRYRFGLLTAGWLCAAAFAAHTPAAKITVHVTTEAGAPIEHAEVTVKSVKGKKASVRWRAHSNVDGIARATGEETVPQGTVEVEVSADEHEPFSQTFEVHDEAQTLEVKLGSGLARLNVHVTTQGGRPIESADVVVRFVRGRSIIELGHKLRSTWEMRTNQEGIAKVPEIPRGTVLIQVIAKGYQTFGKNFDVDQPENNIDIKLNAPQEQYSAH
ncbi:MAG TPA: carboxypeptidase regulatory-like domain-containing protein [Bryobacteraceae bacterium]|nr:carboxypeptidase regulatory-like domain-containing protein [Bryobacteraceae bacterium]